VATDRYQTMRDLVVDLRRLVRRSGVDVRGTDLPAAAPELTRERTGPIIPPQHKSPRWIVTLVGAIAVLASPPGSAAAMSASSRRRGVDPVAVCLSSTKAATRRPTHMTSGRHAAGAALRSADCAGHRISIAFRDQPIDLRKSLTFSVTDLVSGRVRRRAGDALRVAVKSSMRKPTSILQELGPVIHPSSS
jgi:hypothetical protein